MTGTPRGDDDSKNQDEGICTAARACDGERKRFAASGKVERAAREAADLLERDKDELRQAEEAGKRHSYGEDPALKRQGTQPALKRQGTQPG